jgi:hypothetical protein
MWITKLNIYIVQSWSNGFKRTNYGMLDDGDLQIFGFQDIKDKFCKKKKRMILRTNI